MVFQKMSAVSKRSAIAYSERLMGREMSEHPLSALSIEKIENLFKTEGRNINVIRDIVHELSFRKTDRAKAIARKADQKFINLTNRIAKARENFDKPGIFDSKFSISDADIIRPLASKKFRNAGITQLEVPDTTERERLPCSRPRSRVRK